MTILHSCCFWRSVRRGSFASGFYTALYYVINVGNSGYTLYEQLNPNHTQNEPQAPIINHAASEDMQMLFVGLLFVFSVCGLLTTFLLLYGLHSDCKILLIPWISNIVIFTMIDMVYVMFCLVVHALQFNPSTAILVTVDLFLFSLNLYALLCVISQYQELKAGRGRLEDDFNNRVPNIQYSAQPTATSYLSTKRGAVTYHETRPTPTQSPTGTAPSLAVDESSPSITRGSGPRKSVKFPPDTPRNGAQLLDPWTIDVKSPMLLSKGNADTAPLIETGGGVGGGLEPPLQSRV